MRSVTLREPHPARSQSCRSAASQRILVPVSACPVATFGALLSSTRAPQVALTHQADTFRDALPDPAANGTTRRQRNHRNGEGGRITKTTTGTKSAIALLSPVRAIPDPQAGISRLNTNTNGNA